jgi:muramoyltetrapeptide carboxypeptidase
MNTIKPHALKKGDTIGIVAASLPVIPAFRDAYERGKQLIQEAGFSIKEGKTITETKQHFWGSARPEEQAEDITSMFADPQIKAIISQTGGMTAISVLNHIDYDLVKKNPKPFIGMSDITTYHLAFFVKTGLIGFHLDDVTFGLGAESQDEGQFAQQAIERVLTDTRPYGMIDPVTSWDCWKPGSAEGHLIGGHFRTMMRLVGTPYFPSVARFQGALLFWEELETDMCDVYGILHQLKHMGVFDVISGMLIGKTNNLKQGVTDGIDDPSLQEIVLDVTKDYGFPILAHMDFGHYTVNIPMPIGIRAHMNAEKREFALLEGLVC